MIRWYFFFVSMCTLPALSQITSEPGRISTHGGCYLPTQGELKALLLFVQTPEDDQQDTSWPLGQLPTWGDNFRKDLTEYFRVMSRDRLRLSITMLDHVLITRESEATYTSRGQNYGDGIRDLLTELDRDMDFADFDRFNQTAPYHVLPGSDGMVDLVIVVFRCVSQASFFPFTGVSDMGFSLDLMVDEGRRHISGGSGQFNDASRSGITLGRRKASGMITDYDFVQRITIHEMMHKLYGDTHPTMYFAGLGVMGSGGGGIGLSGYERHVLRMAPLRTLDPSPDTTLVLRDVYFDGEAVCIPVPQVEHLFYVFEFRSKRSVWDSSPSRGLYITRVYDHPSASQRSLHIYPAEGKWQWVLDPVSGYPIISTPDPLRGFTRYQNITIDGKEYYPWGYWGDSSMAFTPKTPHFSWFTNPTPDFMMGQDTVHMPWALRILGMTDTTMTVEFAPPQHGILSGPDASALPLPSAWIWPQPARTTQPLWLHYEAHQSGVIQLHVLDLLGREVFREDRLLDPGRSEYRLPLLGPGLYFLRIDGPTGPSLLPIRILE